MVHIREVIEPRAGRVARLRELYLRLVEELARRGWVQPRPVRHAKWRAHLASAKSATDEVRYNTPRRLRSRSERRLLPAILLCASLVRRILLVTHQ